MLLTLLQIIIILLRCQQALDIIRVGHVTPVNWIPKTQVKECLRILLEQPSVREGALVDQSWASLDLLVLLGHLPRHGAEHVAGGLHGLQHTALLIIRAADIIHYKAYKLTDLSGSQLCARVWQLNVDYVTQSIGGICRDPDSSFVALNIDPLVLLCEVTVQDGN